MVLYKFPPDLSPKLLILSAMDGVGFGRSTPSQVLRIWASASYAFCVVFEVVIFSFLLFAVVVLQGASGFDSRRPALGDWGDVLPTVLCAATRLWPPFLPLGISLM